MILASYADFGFSLYWFYTKLELFPNCIFIIYMIDAQFASTDCPFRMNGAGSSVEAV